MYINFLQLLHDYLKDNPKIYSKEKQENLKKTATIGMFLSFDSINWSVQDYVYFCKDYHNHKDYNYIQTYKLDSNQNKILLDGYKITDWLELLSIPPIKQEIKILREKYATDTLESKILKETIEAENSKELKELYNLKKQTKDPSQEIFIYMKAPSIYDNEQINPIQTCSCGNEFLVQKIIPYEWENKNE